MSDTLKNKSHPLSPNGQADISLNESGNPSFDSILNARLSRRDILKGGFGLAASSFLGASLAGYGRDADAAPQAPFGLNFTAVAKRTTDLLTVPAGYSASVLYRLGDPINRAIPDYANDGSDSAASFTARAGDHHDGMHYFGLNRAGTAADYTNAQRGLLAMNHENITQYFLHSAADNRAGFNSASRIAAQIDKEVNAHGVSVIEVVHDSGFFRINKDSGYNRRLTAASLMEISGPVRGDDLMVTQFSIHGTQTRGTLNNCANGYTPWGTYLTCEENWAGYFKRPASNTLTAKEAVAQSRNIGSKASDGAYGWANPAGGDASGSGLYARWDITPGATARSDFRNAANTMGWVVEVDPYRPGAVPRKRTAMGRFAHEGAMPARIVSGKPLVYYMGDDARGEYIYKYVSTRNWDPVDANKGGLEMGDKYLDDGKLYVARFNADGSGQWVELNIRNTAIAAYATYPFADQADVLINCRLAADAVGATSMDRPEWSGVHPLTGDVYVTLTNNSNRGKAGASGAPLGAANPRYYNEDGGKGNPNGHIIRLQESDRNPAAASFNWDVYLFGAEADTTGGSSVNLSALTDDNDFSSPDGLWFSQKTPGLMWLQTDDSAYAEVTNCMMLAALPGTYGDGGRVDVVNKAVPSNGNADQVVTTYVGMAPTAATLKRFLVGPKGCEITGICETPDGKAIFVNIQHPGENTSLAQVGGNDAANFESHWPPAGRSATAAPDLVARPRSATIVITKDDGGIVGS